jgi:hypothetical protein
MQQIGVRWYFKGFCEILLDVERGWEVLPGIFTLFLMIDSPIRVDEY